MRNLHLIALAALMTLPLAGQEELCPCPPPEPPPPIWASSLGAGLALTSGNSDTENINFSFSTLYDPKTKVVFRADALYLRSSTDEVTTVDRTTASGRYEYHVSDRVFAYAGLTFLSDEFKEINYLVSPLVGMGYDIIKTDRTRLSVDGGAGYYFEDNDVTGSESGGSLKAGENFAYKLTDRSAITQNFGALFKVDNFDDAFYHFDVGLTTNVINRIDLKLSYVMDYDAEPPSPEIEELDTSFIATFLYKF